MKYILHLALVLLSATCCAQKYVLIDKRMRLPIAYTNTITVEHGFNGYFPVEKSKIKEFIIEIDKISRLLSDPKTKKPDSFDYLVGSTTIHGIKVPARAEDRIDVILTTDYQDGKSTMHLADAKMSNENNAFFISTWLKYLHTYTE